MRNSCIRRLLTLLLVLATLFCSAMGQTHRHRTVRRHTPAGDHFSPNCTLPFDTIKKAHPIDMSCGPEGAAQTGPRADQNVAKNNFCAAAPPIGVAFDTFDQLMQKAEEKHVSFGFGREPNDRTPLIDILPAANGKRIGEGSQVRVVAYIIDAHYSNVGKGESVNCKEPNEEDNDIHIILGQTADDDPCNSVTGEMSPHFRPDAWTPDNLTGVSTHPVRFTGQLFFDGSHKPCTAAQRQSPPRRSIWEIHPIYAVDVCKKTTIDACPADDETSWVPLLEWTGTDPNEEGTGGPSD